LTELHSPTPAPRASADVKRFPELRSIGDAGFDALVERARHLPLPTYGMVAAGLARVVDFQDVAHGREYLDRLEPFAEIEAASGNPGWPLTSAAAKQNARALAHVDVLPVARLKTRASRAHP